MADMVPHEIEPAKGVGGAPHDAAGEIVLAQVADKPQRPAASGGDLPDDRIDTCLIDVDDAYCRSFTGEPDRPGPAHPGSRGRYDPYLIFEPHGSTPFQFTPQQRLLRGLPEAVCARAAAAASRR